VSTCSKVAAVLVWSAGDGNVKRQSWLALAVLLRTRKLGCFMFMIVRFSPIILLCVSPKNRRVRIIFASRRFYMTPP
jgi:hypothetical protein